ncbi:MAG: GumC family protein [Pseudomonadota bacterium]|nr:GumC family protein [Pseudomonadota bacterium]
MKSRRNLPILGVSHAAPVAYAPTLDTTLPASFASPGLSLVQILSILKAYWKQTLMIVVAFSVLMGGLIKVMPKTYTATTTLMVSPEGGDPLAGTQNQATPMYNYMSTESQLMQSPEVLLPVIDKLGLTQNKDYSAGYSGDGSNLREWVREALAKSLDIQLGAFGSELIFINASARSAQLASQIANTLAEVYLDQQRQRVSGPASERAKRYARELAELKDKVRVAQEQVTAFRQRTGVTDTAERNNVEQALLASLEGKLQDAQNARRAAEVRATAQQNSTAALGSLAVQNIKALLSTQQTQLAQLRTTYGVEHPKVMELESQIRATQHNLDVELRSATSTNTSDLAGAQQLEAKMRAAVEEQRNKVLSVNKLRDEGTKYELELESTQSVYKRALDGYDQIMFASGAHVANISIVSNAIPPQKATKPNKVKLLVMGVLAGIGVGLLAPLTYELLINRRIRSRDDFERSFDLPVLMEFDRIPNASGAA